jgi:hypothetical protein
MKAKDNIFLKQIIVPAVPWKAWFEDINTEKDLFQTRHCKNRDNHEQRESIQEALVGHVCLVYKSTG